MLSEKFASAYYPDQNLSLDESMIPWRGRVSFRMYIPSKPTKYGIKIYCVCDAATGYVVKMCVYTGAGPDGPEKDHGPNVVRKMSEGFHGKGHVFFMDSFFSSPALYDEMKEKGTLAVGTVRQGRQGLPGDIHPKVKKLKKGETTHRRKDDLLCVRYKDKKDVFLLSTVHNATDKVTVGKDRNGNDKVKLKIVDDYNNNMKGVDSFDQNLSYYTFYRKTVKWWKRTAFHLIHLAKVQAYLIYKMKVPGANQYKFSIRLVEQLTETIPRLSSPPPAVPIVGERLSGQGKAHYPSKIPPTESNAAPVKVCVCCSIRDPAKGGRYLHQKRSRSECRKCDVGLCYEPCFEIYHEFKDYKAKAKQVLNLQF